MLYTSKKKSGTCHTSSSLVWRHTSLLGQVKRAQIGMQMVYDAETTTDASKALASEIEGKLIALYNLLQVRRDYNGRS